MSLEFWFSICLSFIGIALSFFTHITKKEKTGAITAIILSFIIAIIFFVIGLINLNNENNPETFSNQLQATVSLTESIDTNTSNNNNSNAMFSNYFETHSPSNIDSYLTLWNPSRDKDIQGNYHQYEVGLKLNCSKYFYINDSVITSDIHLVYNPDYKGNTNFSGKVVLSDSSSGSSSSADISILVDGIEVWKTENKITGTTISPIEYSIDLKDCKEEVIIRTTCYLYNDTNFEIGFF